MLKRFFVAPAAAPAASASPRHQAPAPRPGRQVPAPQVYQGEYRPIAWYGWLAIILLMVLGMSALGLFAVQTWEFVSWLFPDQNFFYRLLALANFDIFSTVWLCLHLFVGLRNGAKVASYIAGGIDLLLSLLCTVIQLMLQGMQQLYGVYKPDPNLIASGMAIVVIALLVNFVALLTTLYSQWPAIVQREPSVYSPAQPVYSPPARRQITEEIDLQQLQLALLAQMLQQVGQPLPLAAGRQQNNSAPAPKTPRARRAPVAASGEGTLTQ